MNRLIIYSFYELSEFFLLVFVVSKTVLEYLQNWLGKFFIAFIYHLLGTLYGNGQFSFEDSKTKTDDWMMNDEYSLKWELFWSNQKSTFYDKKATVGFDNKEGNVLEEGDERKIIDIVEKKESKKDEKRKEKKVEKKEKNDAKYAAKLMREHLKLEKKIIKREEKEKKRMKKAELKLANKQGRESKEAGYKYYELLVDGKYKAKEEKKKVKEEMKKAKEQRKLAEEERKRKLDELKKEMKKRENEEKEKKKQEKEMKKEELLRAKEIHAAFLKEKKRKDKQWKLGLRRGDSKERVKELREKEAKKMTNEEIFMASSVKRKLEELSKGKSSQFRKPFVAWGDNVCNEDVQDNVKSFKNQISKTYELRGQWDDVIEISYCNDV